MRFRKRPIVVDAIRYTGHNLTPVCDQLTHWLATYRIDNDAEPPALHIGTLEGWAIVRPGTWIVRGTVGEVWPVAADLFDVTYEPLTTDNL